MQWYMDKKMFKSLKDDFLFTEVSSKAVCLVCKQSVADLKVLSKYSNEA